jgi:hypothetical protein
MSRRYKCAKTSAPLIRIDDALRDALQSMKSFQVINPDSAIRQGHVHAKRQVKPVQKK